MTLSKHKDFMRFHQRVLSGKVVLSGDESAAFELVSACYQKIKSGSPLNAKENNALRKLQYDIIDKWEFTEATEVLLGSAAELISKKYSYRST